MCLLTLQRLRRYVFVYLSSKFSTSCFKGVSLRAFCPSPFFMVISFIFSYLERSFVVLSFFFILSSGASARHGGCLVHPYHSRERRYLPLWRVHRNNRHFIPWALLVKLGRYLRELEMPPLTMQEEGLSFPLPYVRCLLSRSRMCLGRHCRGHAVHVSRVGGCPHMCPLVGSHAPSLGRQL